VSYGGGGPATMMTVAPKEVLSILRSDHGQNSVIDMHLDGGADKLVMIRDYSYHPVTRALEHVDFIQVDLNSPVDVEVPLLSHGKAAGVTAGGVLRQVYRSLPIRCLPRQIPLKLDVEVTHLNLSEHISTKDLVLPEGVSVRLPPEQTLIAVVAPEKEREAAEETAAAAPAAAAPAAGAKDAKAAAPAKDSKKK